jgi:folate-binding protein YgfZ
MPVEITAPFDEQYRALGVGQAFVELAGWSSIVVTGRDRHKFLNNFCTNDILRLKPGDRCEAFFTNVKGKIVAHGHVISRFEHEDELLFAGPPGQSARLIEHLDRYIIREEVSLSDTSSEKSFLLDTSRKLSSSGLDARINWNLIERYDSLVSELIDQGCVAAGDDAFYVVRIEAGVPIMGVDFGTENLPQEIGRDRQAISFTKGCYLGQETVARIDALGHVNQKIVGVRFFCKQAPPVGAALTRNGSTVGHATSVAISPRLAAPLALAMVRREANAAGTRLESDVGPCEVIALPLPDSDVRT